MRDEISAKLFQSNFSHTFEAKLSSDSGRLFDGSSWSPSLRRGMTSVIFQSKGNVDVRREQLMISVRGPSTSCRQYLITLAFYLALGPYSMVVIR